MRCTRPYGTSEHEQKYYKKYVDFICSKPHTHTRPERVEKLFRFVCHRFGRFDGRVAQTNQNRNNSEPNTNKKTVFFQRIVEQSAVKTRVTPALSTVLCLMRVVEIK